MVESNTIEALTKALSQDPQNTNNTYNAVVSRVDNENVVWVHVAGSDKETPTASTSAEVKQGDSVMVEWRNNKLYIAGNYSNPSAGTTRVGVVERSANEANQVAQNADIKAEEALEKAESAAENNQYFWHTTTNTGFGAGAHITQKPQVDVLADPANAGGNTLINSNGVVIRKGLVPVASFNDTQATIGEETGLHIQLGAQKFGVYDYYNAETYPVFEVDALNGVTVRGTGSDRSLPIIIIGNDNTKPSSVGTHLVVGKNLETPEAQGNRNGHITVGAYNDPSVVDFMGYMPEIMLGGGLPEARATPAYFSSHELKVDLVSCSRINSPVEVGQGAGEGIFVNSRGNIVKVEADVNNQDTNITVIKGITEVRFGVGQGGVNHGIWSEDLQGWMIYCDGSDVIVGGVNTNNIFQKAQIAKGGESLGAINAGTYKDFNISFGKTFSSVPTVVCCLSSTSTSSDLGSISVTPINETTTGFTARVFNNSSNQRSPAIRWIATNGG